ncbi:MAG TPA: MFS transporter [Gemmobacter sp.]|nr:MFS transporter [Gemmobacter sp.]
MSDVTTKPASAALITGHMAGMIDMPALPLWVGILISGYGLAPAQAGGLVTLFLGGVVMSSLLLAPLFHRMPVRWLVPAGYAISGGCFLVMAQVQGFAALSAPHLVAGLFTGMSLSMVHGSMARAANPHRIFALGGLALGVSGIALFIVLPPLVTHHGPQTLFLLLGGIMLLGALVTLFLFPQPPRQAAARAAPAPRFSRATWYGMMGVLCMAFVQAMIFSFAERIGADRGFAPDLVQRALILSGFVSATPAAMAALLQHRLPPIPVAVAGAILQAVVACVIVGGTGYPAYLAGVMLFSFVMLFTHTFVFGHLARIEPSGRANAATPAMVMAGSATAPLLGGMLVQISGYGALGIVALCLAAVAAWGFSRSRLPDTAQPVSA